MSVPDRVRSTETAAMLGLIARLQHIPALGIRGGRGYLIEGLACVGYHDASCRLLGLRANVGVCGQGWLVTGHAVAGGLHRAETEVCAIGKGGGEQGMFVVAALASSHDGEGRVLNEAETHRRSNSRSVPSLMNILHTLKRGGFNGHRRHFYSRHAAGTRYH